MKIRSLKQVLHWLFLAIGLFSLIMLAITVNTYLGYAEEGYGLKMEFDEAWLNENWLVLNFNIENPGGLDVEIISGNLTLSQTYNIPNSHPVDYLELFPIDLPAKDETSVFVWIPISELDLESIRASGQVELDMEFEILVPDRYMITDITFQETVGVNL